MAAAALPVLLVWAGAFDLITRSIPNSVALLLAASFFAFAGSAGISAPQLVTHMICGCTVLAAGFALFYFSLIGGGDAKLLASASCWFGFENIVPFLAAVALAGGVLALICLILHQLRAQLGLEFEPSPAIPYGAAIAAGGLAILPDALLVI
ncbi:MAG: prepilin peptidase [Rhodomicrobium sp.]